MAGVGPQNRGCRTPISGRPPVEENPTRICELIACLGEVVFLGVDDEPEGRWRCMFGRGAGRRVGAAVGSKGLTPGARLTCPRSAARCVWCGTSGGGVARRRAARSPRSPRSLSGSRRRGEPGRADGRPSRWVSRSTCHPPRRRHRRDVTDSTWFRGRGWWGC